MTAPLASPRPPAGLPFAFLAVLLDLMGVGLIIPIMPALLGEFLHGDLAATATAYGLLASLFPLGQFLCAPVWGALSDQYGRRPLLLLSMGVSAIAYALIACAPALGWVFAGRALAGVGGGALTVASAYVADVSTPETRARCFGMLGAAFGLALILGPAVGGLLGAHDLRWPLWAACALAGLNLAYGLAALPESHRAEHRRAFAWARANPLGWVGLFRRHALIGRLGLALVLVNLAQGCMQGSWVLFTGQRFGWTPAQVGASLAAAGALGVLVNGGLVGAILPRLGERRAILGGIGLMGLALAGYGLATAGWMFYAVMIASSVGAVAGPATQGLLSRQVGPDEQGALQGGLASLTSLTGVVAPLAANLLFARFSAPDAPLPLPGIGFFLGAACCAAALASAWRALRPEAEAVAEAA